MLITIGHEAYSLMFLVIHLELRTHLFIRKITAIGIVNLLCVEYVMATGLIQNSGIAFNMDNGI